MFGKGVTGHTTKKSRGALMLATGEHLDSGGDGSKEPRPLLIGPRPQSGELLGGGAANEHPLAATPNLCLADSYPLAAGADFCASVHHARVEAEAAHGGVQPVVVIDQDEVVVGVAVGAVGVA